MIGKCECKINMDVGSICILRPRYVWLVVCGVQWYVVWRSVVCGGNWYLGISALWGKGGQRYVRLV